MNIIRCSLPNGIRRTRRLFLSSASHCDPNNPQLFYPSQPSLPYRALPYNARAFSNNAHSTTGWTGEAMIADAKEAKETQLVEAAIPHITCQPSSVRVEINIIQSRALVQLKQCLFPAALHEASMVTSYLSGGGHFSRQSRAIATTSTMKNSQDESDSSNGVDPVQEVAPRIKIKRLTKTAKHIMQILDAEAVQAVKTEREIPDFKPGHIVELKVEVPENKRRVSVLKGIIIARRNAGLNSTFRIRRQVAGVGVESVFPLYSPNIKEIKVLDQKKKKVRRAKLYYLRDKMGSGK